MESDIYVIPAYAIILAAPYLMLFSKKLDLTFRLKLFFVSVVQLSFFLVAIIAALVTGLDVILAGAYIYFLFVFPVVTINIIVIGISWLVSSVRG